MNIVRNILAVVLGLVGGNLVNMGLITLGHIVMPPPAGFDPNSMEGVASTIHLLQPVDYIVPFLAHALGTFVGVLIAMFVAATRQKAIGLGLGVVFLLGGVIANIMIPAPIWYRIIDVVLAYIPMALLARKVSGKG